jgi:hypothetical protein
MPSMLTDADPIPEPFFFDREEMREPDSDSDPLWL